MARYVDSKCKLCRREGVKLFLKGSRCDTVKCSVVKRKSIPGQKSRRLKKLSEYGIHFREKQKLKRFYGVFERQFRNYFAKSERKEGNTGQNLLVLLERRLDNVLFHLGYGLSRSHTRQVINHGHITVNGKKVDIASFLVKAGDVIKPKNSEKCSEFVKQNVDSRKSRNLPSWLEFDDVGLEGRVLHLPTQDDVSIAIQEQLVVELCSK
ncbi:MAG: 30S ribosomal protein S4 [Candidatus Scalindua sp. AMX11]|nr:MAG: 30S ribosomal protein S4 [Candidatus Scalindua sp.]NOG85514.1 30S ribosomal protein S4 [Planctomycetota bacterium]RZV90237.1 MAG: 30S ribosomal protein S4 [Candidatus Scalindua sp. SCAELEC01]TDE64648.1 MAG: 30S ribosomal protein S4 [Candidatus Scalindua sp. AMX11]GJQ57514.1 MAG: 30S ribosomal protein S4 [Candidatus Scalindua sp.]